MSADPNTEAQIAAAQAVAGAFHAAKTAAEKQALGKSLKAKLDAIVWDD